MPKPGHITAAIFAAISLLALAPGTTCVVLAGLGLDHHHHVDDDHGEVICFGDSHHGGDSGEIPCPDAEGETLESDFLGGGGSVLTKCVWFLIDSHEWEVPATIREGMLEKGNLDWADTGYQRGSPGHPRVLFCR